jgi:hypothetical protein
MRYAALAGVPRVEIGGNSAQFRRPDLETVINPLMGAAGSLKFKI